MTPARLVLLLAVALVRPAAAEPPRAPFAVDGETLFLAHYDTTLDADFSLGSPAAEGNASLVAGRGPGGSTAALLKRGLTLSPDGVRLPFRALTYELEDNLDPAAGTLEFWFAPDFSERRPAAGRYLHYLCDARRGSSVGVVILILAAEDGARTLAFWERATADQPEVNLGCPVTAWTPGEWHHLAVTWRGRERGFFVDGNLVGGRDDAPEQFSAAGGSFRFGSVRWNDHFADGALDEVRISKGVRYDR